ncbi:MAG: two-component regulator propeller domain-containing protein [Agriterribacter sp.]
MRYHCCILLVLYATAAFSQDYRIQHWGVEDGLSQGINQKILKDKRGFLWITSYEGLNRFDGKNFKNFYSFPEKRNAIRGAETTGLVEDSLHNIWIGSGEGLNRYDPVADSTVFFLPEVKKNAQHYFIPLAASAGEVICYDIGGQLTAFSIRNLKKRVICNNISWHNDYLSATYNWLDNKRNILWMPAEHGLLKIHLNTGDTSTWFATQKINTVVYNDQKQLMIIGTNDGCMEWNMREANNIRHVKALNAQPLHKVTSLATDIYHNTWLGTEEYGIFMVSGDGNVLRFNKNNDRQSSISDNKINTIYCDNDGTVWAGIATNGIDQLIPGNRFEHFRENSSLKNNLTNNIVRCFFEDEKKQVWIATQGGGINIFDPEQKAFSSITQKNVPGLPFNFIRFMVKEDNQALIGTERGMCRLNRQTFAAQKIHFTGNESQFIYDPYIEQIIDFANDSWLIATKSHGLFELKKKADTARQLDFPGNKHVFYTTFINNLLFVSLWEGSQKIFEIKNGNWVEIKKDLSSFLITYVLYDQHKKRYWIGTLKGLLEADTDLNVIHHYTTDDGLSNNYVYALLQDEAGMIWISTNKGLSMLDPATGVFNVFTPSDGLQGYEYNAKACLRSSDNKLYFGGVNGFDIIKPAAATPAASAPSFYIKELLVNNISLPGDRNISYISTIQLPYTGNNITIQSGVIDFMERGKSKIYYRLKGIDSGWQSAERDFVINYSGLPPGSYTFNATASAADGNKTGSFTTLQIQINKPWWQTWWFRSVMSIILLAIAGAVIHAYYSGKWEKQKALLEKQSAIEQERNRIATDMHDDLGAGLSRIRFLSETIGLKKGMQQPIEEELGKMRWYAHEMIDKMGEIVWALNQKNDTLPDLITYTRAYAVEYLSQNNIQCIMPVPGKIPEAVLSGEYRRNVFLAVKEALHNIVKHAHATWVKMHITCEDLLHIIIHDNGVGFNETALKKAGNGLHNMRKRISDIKGEMHISTHDGTRVQFKIPFPV